MKEESHAEVSQPPSSVWPVPDRLVTVAERVRRTETVTEGRIRVAAPTPDDAAAALLQLWRHPDRFPTVGQAVGVEHAFRTRHRRLEIITAGSVIAVPLLDGASPAADLLRAGANEALVWAVQIGFLVPSLAAIGGTFVSALTLMRMGRRRQLPDIYSQVRAWTDEDPVNPHMAATAAYNMVNARHAADSARTALRRLALITRKHAARDCRYGGGRCQRRRHHDTDSRCAR